MFWLKFMRYASSSAVLSQMTLSLSCLIICSKMFLYLVELLAEAYHLVQMNEDSLVALSNFVR